ncbi:MAG: hypothetical protein QGI45_09660 [Myxococcota bacterium]|jgi:hypothetical protein|nr:hypothetical protein [Myxococcota bacterium]
MQEQDSKQELIAQLEAIGTSSPFSDMDEQALEAKVMRELSQRKPSRNAALWLGLAGALSAGLLFGVFFFTEQAPPAEHQHWLALVYEAESSLEDDMLESESHEYQEIEYTLGWELNDNDTAIAQWLFPNEQVSEIDLSEYL